uniref:Uncharacterized protein n=1 Tax=Zea mays TaxID=4577 RepID=B4FI04_MAIZE|nr:unknown [Zea mays]
MLHQHDGCRHRAILESCCASRHHHRHRNFYHNRHRQHHARDPTGSTICLLRLSLHGACCCHVTTPTTKSDANFIDQYLDLMDITRGIIWRFLGPWLHRPRNKCTKVIFGLVGMQRKV